MSRPKSIAAALKDSPLNLGFEAKLWHAVDKLRYIMGAAKYKYVVLGLVFLKDRRRHIGRPLTRGSIVDFLGCNFMDAA